MAGSYLCSSLSAPNMFGNICLQRIFDHQGWESQGTTQFDSVLNQRAMASFKIMYKTWDVNRINKLINIKKSYSPSPAMKKKSSLEKTLSKGRFFEVKQTEHCVLFLTAEMVVQCRVCVGQLVSFTKAVSCFALLTLVSGWWRRKYLQYTWCGFRLANAII